MIYPDDHNARMAVVERWSYYQLGSAYWAREIVTKYFRADPTDSVVEAVSSDAEPTS